MKTRALLIVFLIVYWLIGFYPFQLTGPFTFQRGEITKSSTNGFIFPQRSIASSASGMIWLIDAIRLNRLTLKFSAITKDIEPQALARILTISMDDDNRNITIGQKLNNLVVYVRTVVDDPAGDVYVIPRVFSEEKKLSVSVDLTPDGLLITIDGNEQLRAALPEDYMRSWDAQYKLALGNELTYAFPWQGELSPVEISVGANSYIYSFDDLYTAGVYQTGQSLLDYKLKNAFSLKGWRDNVGADWVINFFGFIPLGLLLALIYRQSMSFTKGLILCGLMSLTIEISQFFIESRTPQITDLVLNTLGGGAGGWFGAWLHFIGRDKMPN